MTEFSCGLMNCKIRPISFLYKITYNKLLWLWTELTKPLPGPYIYSKLLALDTEHVAGKP